MRVLPKTRYFKELLLGAVVLTLVVGPFQPLIAHAAGTTDTTGSVGSFTPTNVNSVSSTVVPLSGGADPLNSGISNGNTTGTFQPGITADNTGGTNAALNTTAAPTTPAASPNAAGAAAQQLATDPPQCNWTGNWDLCLTNVVYVFTVGIGSSFAYVASTFFNIAVNLSLNGPIYALTFISTGWTTARDLANMAFLFILIYIAFMIILEAETSGTMSLLAGVVVIALLVNFSFFFTRIVIDAGNILSIEFYNSISAPTIQGTANGGGVAGAVAGATNIATNLTAGVTGGNTKDLTASIMGMLKLQNLFNLQSFQNFYAPKDPNNKPTFMVVVVTLSFLYIAAGIMFYLITVMFVTAGVKFLVRIVVLWFLIIASPLAFVARAMPAGTKFRHYFDDWREMLVAHAFYPVAFMFIFLILTNFTNQMGNCTNNGTSSSQSCLLNDIFSGISAGGIVTAGGTSTPAIITMGMAIANVAIRMGFVLAVLYIGMKVSDKISVVGADFAKTAGNWAGGAYKNTMSYLPGAAYRNTIGLGANKLDSSLKNSEWANKRGWGLGGLGGVVGYRLRKNVLAPLQATSLGTSASSFKERGEYLDKRKTDMDQNKRSVQNKQDLDWMTTNSTNYNIYKKLTTRSPDQQKLVDEGDRIKTRMKNFGKKDFEGAKFADLKSMISIITENQLKTIKEGDKLNEQQKEELTQEWNTQNPASSYQKAHKELDELRTIAGELHTAGITLGEIDRYIGGASTAARSGELVTKDIVKDMHKEAKATMASIDQDIADANKTGSGVPKATIVKMRENKEKLKDAMEYMTRLSTATGDVQANIGGEKEEGKFRTK